MKFIIPMAGAGTRLRPFTFSKPKGFFKVAGKRLIDHILDKFMQASSNSSDLFIITGSQERAVIEYIQKEYSTCFNLTFESQVPKGYHGNIPYFGGLGQAILLSEKWYSKVISAYDSTDPDDYAIINLNDMLPMDGYNDFVNLLCKTPSSQTKSDHIENVDGVIGIMAVPQSQISSYGIVEVDPKTGYIRNLVEKPTSSPSNLAIAGVYGFKPTAMKNLYKFLRKEVKKFEGKEGEAQLTPAIHDLVQHGFKIMPMQFEQGILDFGKYSTLLEGNKFLLTQHNNVREDIIGELSHSSLNSPSFIGKNVMIKNCVIGPYCSIGDDCVLIDCIVRNSVVGEGCHLERIITQNSIIGDLVIMESIIKNNMIIGDQSNIRSSKKDIANSI